MSVDMAIAKAYLDLAADLAQKAANIASACPEDVGEKIEKLGDQVHDLIRKEVR